MALLRDGDLDLVGRLIASSNNALYCAVTQHCPDPEPDLTATCVYKPIVGERPLDDFPDGTLAHREVAAHVLSEATGWSIVPPTVLRDGPFGPGMVQLWIEVDPDVDPLDLIRAGDDGLRRMALFDVVANNADRKVGHLLPVPGGHVYGVDHGICFSDEPKLRTVLWNWRSQRLSAEEVDVLGHVRDGMDARLGKDLSELIAPAEVAATTNRLDHLLAAGRFPRPDPDRPAIPWPPF